MHYDLPSAMPPSANVLDDLRFDLALGQIKLGPPLGQSQFYYLSKFSMIRSLLQSFDPHLLEECHDIVDYFTENAGVVVPTLDKITTLFGMLVKGYKFTSFILGDHFSSVTCTTGS